MVNRLNSPTSLGVDSKGYIWIYDKGNSYIRLLKVDLTDSKWFEKALMYTMIKGVCNPLPSHLTYFSCL